MSPGDLAMNRTFLSFCGITILSAVLAENALAGTSLNGNEIQKLLSGKTVSGTVGKAKQFIKTYDSDGTYSLVVNEEKWDGTWRVTGDKYCQTQFNKEQCYTVEKNNGTYRMLELSGTVHTTFSVK